MHGRFIALFNPIPIHCVAPALRWWPCRMTSPPGRCGPPVTLPAAPARFIEAEAHEAGSLPPMRRRRMNRSALTDLARLICSYLLCPCRCIAAAQMPACRASSAMTLLPIDSALDEVTENPGASRTGRARPRATRTDGRGTYTGLFTHTDYCWNAETRALEPAEILSTKRSRDRSLPSEPAAGSGHRQERRWRPHRVVAWQPPGCADTGTGILKVERVDQREPGSSEHISTSRSSQGWCAREAARFDS
jgi:hypothetical protein